MMDSMMTFPAECQKVILSIISSLGSMLDVMNLEMPVAAAELAGEFIPPEDVDHNLLLAPKTAERICVLECLVSSHARDLLGWPSPMPAR